MILVSGASSHKRRFVHRQAIKAANVVGVTYSVLASRYEVNRRRPQHRRLEAGQRVLQDEKSRILSRRSPPTAATT